MNEFELERALLILLTRQRLQAHNARPRRRRLGWGLGSWRSKRRTAVRAHPRRKAELATVSERIG